MKIRDTNKMNVQNCKKKESQLKKTQKCQNFTVNTITYFCIQRYCFHLLQRKIKDRNGHKGGELTFSGILTLWNYLNCPLLYIIRIKS